MPRYIDADAVIRELGTEDEDVYCYHLLESAPTVDAVEVVRCRDCKYGHRLTDANGYNYRTCNYPWGHGMMVEEYGFCKWGERRESNECAD